MGSTKPLRHATPNRIQAVPFYSQDFSGGIPETGAIDHSGNGLNWTWTTTGSFLLLRELIPWVPAVLQQLTDTWYSTATLPAVLAGEDGDLITETIDCSANIAVHLTFNQLLCTLLETARVSVSNDGGASWNDVYDASAGLAQYQATPNPDFVDVDITAYAAGQATVQVWNLISRVIMISGGWLMMFNCMNLHQLMAEFLPSMVHCLHALLGATGKHLRRNQQLRWCWNPWFWCELYSW